MSASIKLSTLIVFSCEVSIVFYVYRPMAFCKRSEATLSVKTDVDDRELAL